MHPAQKNEVKVPDLSEEINDLFKIREKQVIKIDRVQESINTRFKWINLF